MRQIKTSGMMRELLEQRLSGIPRLAQAAAAAGTPTSAPGTPSGRTTPPSPPASPSASDVLPPPSGGAPPFGPGGPPPSTPGVPGNNLPDDYKERLVKLIPAEVVGAYLACHSLMSAGKATDALKWVVFILLLLGTPTHLYLLGNVRNIGQLAISTGAFLIWVVNIGAPFQVDPLHAGLSLILYTFAVPMIHKVFDP